MALSARLCDEPPALRPFSRTITMTSQVKKAMFTPIVTPSERGPGQWIGVSSSTRK